MHTCASDPVPVSWVASDSAKYYTAVAVSGGGHRSQCMTNNTSCSLPGLLCGEVYTIGVSGVDDNCTGQLSDTASLNTGNTTLTTSKSWMRVFIFLLNSAFVVIYKIYPGLFCFPLQSHVLPLMYPVSGCVALPLRRYPGHLVPTQWAIPWKPSAADRTSPVAAPAHTAPWVTWSVGRPTTSLWLPLMAHASATTVPHSDKTQVQRETSGHV